MTDYTLLLKDGRTLSYALYGPDNGMKVLYFHGTPSSRREILLLKSYGLNIEDLLQDAGIQLIAVDRPGMGLSSYHTNKTFISFAHDAKALLDHLSITHCPILCWSGGGPYSLAMAYWHPKRVASVHILCGFTIPFNAAVLQQMNRNKLYFQTARYAPWLLEASMNFLRKKPINGSIPQWITGLPYVDYALLKDVPHLSVIADVTMKEACRNGARGAVEEAASYYNEFGYSLSAIEQPIHYWWGTFDNAVVRLHAEAVEQQARNSIMHYRQNEGHLSLYINCFKEALQVISTG